MALASQCMEEMQSFTSLKYVRSELFRKANKSTCVRLCVAVGLEEARCFETQLLPRDVYLSSGWPAASLMYKLKVCRIAHVQTESVFLSSDACSEI